MTIDSDRNRIFINFCVKESEPGQSIGRYVYKIRVTGLRGRFPIQIHKIMNDVLDTEERKELPDSVYGLPERREYPMPDAAHVRAAEAYFRYCPEELKPRLARAILRFANEYGVDVQSPTILSYADE